MLQSFFWGGTVIKNGWYLQTQLLLYIIFYFSFKKEGTDQRKLWLLCGFTCIYYIACNLLKMSYTWYVSMPLFVVGMLWQKNREYGDKFLEKDMNWKTMVISLAMATILWVMGTKIPLPSLFSAILMTASMTCLSVLIMTLVKLIRIDWKITRFLGVISLEIYVLQGLFLSLYHSPIAYIANPYFYIAVVSVSTILCAWVTHPIFRWIDITIRERVRA